jgi:TonB-dependent SusC/RagA subfamily outer membrane receptor
MRKLLFPLSAVVLMVGARDLHAQNRPLTGRVVGSDGVGLPGVTVLVKGGTQGTATDVDGRYTLSAPATATTLVFSFVGFTSQEARIGDGPINVTLVSNPTSLDEAVVVGYGTQERRDLTGSIATVQGEAVANLATPSFAQQLGGRAAGVNVQTPSALLGTQPRIQIRGTNSISSGSSPLVVVDGQPIFTGNTSAFANGSNALADINPNDIESYEILKDGSATAIYGSRAANGVILITTKRGRKGKANVSYDTYLGVAQTLKRYSVLNASDFKTIANERDRNAGGTGIM